MIARLILPVVWLVLAALPVSAAPWLDQADACLASLRHDEERAAPLKTGCPALSRALRDDPWADVLTVPAVSLSVWSIDDLAELAGRYRESPTGPVLAPGALDAALAALPESRTAEQATLWDIVRERLRKWLSGRDGVLPDWLPSIPVNDATARWLLYGGAALILLMAAALLFAEVRYWHRRRDGRGLEGPMPDTAGPCSSPPPAAVGRTPAEQLQGLFAAVVDRLQRLGLLPARPSLTHREVAARADIPPAQRDVVGLLGSGAERVRFGAWTPARVEVTAHLEAGRRLLDELAETPR